MVSNLTHRFKKLMDETKREGGSKRGKWELGVFFKPRDSKNNYDNTKKKTTNPESLTTSVLDITKALPTILPKLLAQWGFPYKTSHLKRNPVLQQNSLPPGWASPTEGCIRSL